MAHIVAAVAAVAVASGNNGIHGCHSVLYDIKGQGPGLVNVLWVNTQTLKFLPLQEKPWDPKASSEQE